MIESLYILIITAAACSILGVFLVLRRLSMVSDAISHSVLLGIVIGFFITKDLRSVWLIVAAALFGVFTTMAIEVLIKSRRVGEDAAVGIIFPLFFSIAVILITRFARNVPSCRTWPNATSSPPRRHCSSRSRRSEERR